MKSKFKTYKFFVALTFMLLGTFINIFIPFYVVSLIGGINGIIVGFVTFVVISLLCNMLVRSKIFDFIVIRVTELLNGSRVRLTKNEKIEIDDWIEENE